MTHVNACLIASCNQRGAVPIKVSVLVAVYNVEKYLPQCLESLISQTLEEVEFIIVDDGSTDNSARICDEYARKDSRFRVIHKVQNEGTLRARKIVLSEAKGKWIVFVDGDDWLSTDSLKILYDHAETEKVDILQFNVDVVGGSREFRDLFLSYLGKDNDRGFLKNPKKARCEPVFFFIGGILRNVV